MTFNKTDIVEAPVAVALLCKTPSDIHLRFYRQLREYGYKVFFIADQPILNDVSAKQDEFPRISAKHCISKGFINLNPVIIRTKQSTMSRRHPAFRLANRFLVAPVTSWERALFFFSFIHTDYRHVWLIEDDVLIPKLDVLRQIDRDYPNSDILSEANRINLNGDLDDWFWWRNVPEDILPLPWANSMVCIVRLSRSLMTLVAETLLRHRLFSYKQYVFHGSKDVAKFFFIEYLFHTLAIHNKKIVEHPKNFETVKWKKQWSFNDINQDGLYHPVKNIDFQKKIHEYWYKHTSK